MWSEINSIHRKYSWKYGICKVQCIPKYAVVNDSQSFPLRNIKQEQEQKHGPKKLNTANF